MATSPATTQAAVPFFKPYLTDAEEQEVLKTLRSGWLTTGDRVKRFEEQFAAAVGSRNAVAVNSCTAALHLAVEALGLKAGQGVLVPTMTFAATAEVIRYQGAIPILVDCDATTLNLSLEDAILKLEWARQGRLFSRSMDRQIEVVGMIPVHVGGMMMSIESLRAFARQEGLWIVEDGAHAFPAAWRSQANEPWQRCGEGTADVSCFSFYANKTITTGEGGMAVTDDGEMAKRIRMMSLHGLSHDAWNRYSSGGAWDYKIMAPGFKYNMTDIAAAIGIHQLSRAELMRQERAIIACQYRERLSAVLELELPPEGSDRVHSWHLYPIKLNLERLTIDRNRFIEELMQRGIGCSVHWRPLHLHPYYEQAFGWKSEDLPIATGVWQRLISLPIFPGMNQAEIETVGSSVAEICRSHAR